MAKVSGAMGAANIALGGNSFWGFALFLTKDGWGRGGKTELYCQKTLE